MAKVVSVEPMGVQEVYDLGIDEFHNFFANGVVVHNCMSVSRVLSGFTGPEANKLRKAIGKKLKDVMAEMKDKFIKGAQSKVDAGEIKASEVEEVWNQVESFAGYGFNKSIDIDSVVWCNGDKKRVGEVEAGDRVLCFDGNVLVETKVVANHDHGVLPAFEVEFEGGKKVVCSILHKFETPRGKVPLWKLMFGGEVLCVERDERLGMLFLPGCVSYEKGFGEAQVGESVSSDSGLVWVGGLSGMRKEISKRGTMPEASSNVSGGEDHSQREQVAEGDGEYTIGSCRCGGNDGGGKVGEGKGSLCRCVGHAGGFGVQKNEHGGVEWERRVQGEVKASVVCGGDKDFYEEGLIGTSDGEFAPVEGGSSGGVCCDLGEGKKVSEEVEGRCLVGRESFEGCGVQEGGADRLSRQEEVGGLCAAGHVDRSGWMLALWPGVCEQEVRGEGIQSRFGAFQGYALEQGGGKARGCNAGSGGRGLREGQQEQSDATRMAGGIEGIAERAEARSVSMRRVLSTRFVGFRRMCDLEVYHLAHNFVLANGVVTSNSHAICYSALSTAEMWLKYHYGVEFVTALINNTKPGKKKHGSENILVDYINYARRNGKEVLGPDVNKSGEEFTIDGGKIRFSLGHVKNVASAAPAIMSFQPFTSMEDFYNRVKMGPKEELEEKKDVEAEPDCIDEADEGQARSPEEVEEWKKMVLEEVAKVAKKRSVVRRPNKKVVESLIAAGAFDCFGSRNDVMKEYYRLRKNKKEVPSEYNEEQEVEREKEMLGICLSRPPIRKKHELLIQQKGWVKISDVADHASKKIRVFGMAENIRPHTSKAGNSMYIVQWTDGVDTMKFLVFQGGQQLFRDNFKVGVVGAVPLSKFDEGDTRFFDDNKICEMV